MVGCEVFIVSHILPLVSRLLALSFKATRQESSRGDVSFLPRHLRLDSVGGRTCWYLMATKNIDVLRLIGQSALRRKPWHRAVSVHSSYNTLFSYHDLRLLQVLTI